MAASAAGDSRPQIRKGLDSNYIRGYNCTRDTTYRSPRPSRLSPTAQRQAGGPLPESHPTTQNQPPQPPAWFNHMRERSPLMGEGSSPFMGGWQRKPAGGPKCAGPKQRTELPVHRHLDGHKYEPQGQEASQSQIPPADAAARPPDQHGRGHRHADLTG